MRKHYAIRTESCYCDWLRQGFRQTCWNENLRAPVRSQSPLADNRVAVT
jgi:hypothetical protein